MPPVCTQGFCSCFNVLYGLLEKNYNEQTALEYSKQLKVKIIKEKNNFIKKLLIRKIDKKVFDYITNSYKYIIKIHPNYDHCMCREQTSIRKGLTFSIINLLDREDINNIIKLTYLFECKLELKNILNKAKMSLDLHKQFELHKKSDDLYFLNALIEQLYLFNIPEIQPILGTCMDVLNGKQIGNQIKVKATTQEEQEVQSKSFRLEI